MDEDWDGDGDEDVDEDLDGDGMRMWMQIGITAPVGDEEALFHHCLLRKLLGECRIISGVVNYPHSRAEHHDDLRCQQGEHNPNWTACEENADPLIRKPYADNTPAPEGPHHFRSERNTRYPGQIEDHQVPRAQNQKAQCVPFSLSPFEDTQRLQLVTTATWKTPITAMSQFLIG